MAHLHPLPWRRTRVLALYGKGECSEIQEQRRIGQEVHCLNASHAVHRLRSSTLCFSRHAQKLLLSVVDAAHYHPPLLPFSIPCLHIAYIQAAKELPMWTVRCGQVHVSPQTASEISSGALNAAKSAVSRPQTTTMLLIVIINRNNNDNSHNSNRTNSHSNNSNSSNYNGNSNSSNCNSHGRAERTAG